jgi:hypothetical protein
MRSHRHDTGTTQQLRHTLLVFELLLPLACLWNMRRAVRPGVGTLQKKKKIKYRHACTISVCCWKTSMFISKFHRQSGENLSHLFAFGGNSYRMSTFLTAFKQSDKLDHLGARENPPLACGSYDWGALHLLLCPNPVQVLVSPLSPLMTCRCSEFSSIGPVSFHRSLFLSQTVSETSVYVGDRFRYITRRLEFDTCPRSICLPTWLRFIRP